MNYQSISSNPNICLDEHMKNLNLNLLNTKEKLPQHLKEAFCYIGSLFYIILVVDHFPQLYQFSLSWGPCTLVIELQLILGSNARSLKKVMEIVC